MRKLIVSEFFSLDGVVQAPGGADEDTEGGFQHGGWTMPYWHDDIGATFGALMQDVDAFLLGRKTYLIHGNAFEPLPPGDPFGDLMNAPAKYVVSKTLEKPVWRNTTIIRDNVVDEIRKLKAAPGKTIICDGSHQLVHTLLQHDLVDELHLLRAMATSAACWAASARSSRASARRSARRSSTASVSSRGASRRRWSSLRRAGSCAKGSSPPSSRSFWSIVGRAPRCAAVCGAAPIRSDRCSISTSLPCGVRSARRRTAACHAQP